MSHCGFSGVPNPRSCALAAARDIHSGLMPASWALSVTTSCQALKESLQFFVQSALCEAPFHFSLLEITEGTGITSVKEYAVPEL